MNASLAWRGLYGGGFDLVVPESRAHPAKGSHRLFHRILEHLEELGLLHPGATIIDPMGGTGVTALMAGMKGYRAITVELERRFIGYQRQNKEYAEKRLRRKLDWTILQGDARCLSALLQERELVSVLSPPYASALQQGEGVDPLKVIAREQRYVERHPEYPRPGGAPVYGTTPGQIGAMPDKGYVGVTSPVYESGGHHKDALRGGGGATGQGTQEKYGEGYGDTDGQIANEDYSEAMAQVYGELARVCRVLVVVTKNPTRNGKLRRLDKTTYRLMRETGWRIVDYHRAILWEEQRRPTLFGDDDVRPRGRMSFFKRLSYRKGSPVARWEDVLFAVRDGEGAVAVTSPPHIDMLHDGGGIDLSKLKEPERAGRTAQMRHRGTYGDTPGQIGRLKD